MILLFFRFFLVNSKYFLLNIVLDYSDISVITLPGFMVMIRNSFLSIELNNE